MSAIIADPLGRDIMVNSSIVTRSDKDWAHRPLSAHYRVLELAGGETASFCSRGTPIESESAIDAGAPLHGTVLIGLSAESVSLGGMGRENCVTALLGRDNHTFQGGMLCVGRDVSVIIEVDRSILWKE